MEHTKKMVVVPQELADAMLHSKRYEQTETTFSNSLDKSMNDVLSRQDLNDYDKVTLYNQILQRYLQREKRVTNPQPISMNIESNQTSKEEKLDGVTKEIKPDPIVTGALNSVSATQKSKTKKLREWIERYRDTGVIDWNAYGEVSFDGELIKGSNLIDLVKDIVQGQRGFEPKGWKDFLVVLAKINTPESLIGNSTRRTVLQRIKSGRIPPPKSDVQPMEVESPKFEAVVKKKTTSSKRKSSKPWLNF